MLPEITITITVPEYVYQEKKEKADNGEISIDHQFTIDHQIGQKHLHWIKEKNKQIEHYKSVIEEQRKQLAEFGIMPLNQFAGIEVIG